MQTDPLSTKFAALADPTRRAILARLALGETSVTELAKPFDMSMPAISKHLKVLEGAGLITRSREAQMRPCKIAPSAFKDVDGWLEDYRKLWEERFDRLDAYLQKLQAKQRKKRRQTGEDQRDEGSCATERQQALGARDHRVARLRCAARSRVRSDDQSARWSNSGCSVPTSGRWRLARSISKSAASIAMCGGTKSAATWGWAASIARSNGRSASCTRSCSTRIGPAAKRW